MAKIVRIMRQDAERRLSNMPEEYVFWCCDGRILRNMRELRAALDTMTDETFAYHSDGGKSDFSNWVKDIIGDEKLARDLHKATSRTRAAKSVTARIAFLSSKLV